MARFYTGQAYNWRSEEQGPVSLPGPLSRAFENPAGYVPDAGLVDAVNVALTLGQPLLLTGEPGTGKTQLAYNVAKELGLPRPIKYSVKSTTEARDLFYRFDRLRQFHDVQLKRRPEDADELAAAAGYPYLTLQALGLAYVRASAGDAPGITPLLQLPSVQSAFETAAWWQEQAPAPPHRSVVLIDEVDKAPRDVPNDILNEIELYEFEIAELNPSVRIRARSDLRPVIILTSNSEKNLPLAFLRRCIYYDIPFPWNELRTIVENRLSEFAGIDVLLDEAIDLFRLYRAPADGLADPPGTAELLAWLKALLEAGLVPDKSLRARPELVEPTLCSIVKSADDQDRARSIFERWLEEAG